MLLATSNPSAGAAARLIEQALGTEAMHRYRSSERCFPLWHRGTCFSVSHTAAVTVVAVSTGAVGVDIEQRIPCDAAVDLAWALSDHELSELANDDDGCLTEIWTTKEASGKALGLGLGPAPNRIHTLPILHVPGFRTSELPLSGAELTYVLTYGWWIEDHHIRLAWPSGVHQGGVRRPRDRRALER